MQVFSDRCIREGEERGVHLIAMIMKVCRTGLLSSLKDDLFTHL